jgi:hypothetical protein
MSTLEDEMNLEACDLCIHLLEHERKKFIRYGYDSKDSIIDVIEKEIMLYERIIQEIHSKST